MIRLHLLGTLRLDAGRAGPRRSALTQPRRVALLVYLALRAPRGPERRDTLLGVFWPESDTNHARGALRNALHFLRGSLGREAIRSHGSEEVQLDLDHIWCDAIEFERLCDSGDYAAALRIYGGDLLAGFFTSEAPAFEQWLDGERERLRQRAVAAARTLAAEAEAGGERSLAVHRLRHLLELAPTDEAAIRDLMRLLAACGDRGEALRVFHELQTRLDDEYGLEAAVGTRDLAESIREGAAAAASTQNPQAGEASGLDAAEPAAVHEPASAAEIAPSSVTSAGPAFRRQATAKIDPSRHRRVALLASALIVALAPIGFAVLKVSAGPEAPSAEIVAVLPFEYRGGTEHAYLAEGLADLLAANLNGAGDLRAVDPRALLPRVQSLGPSFDAASASRAAATHGAGLVVLGLVTEAAGRLRITATLYGPGARGTSGATNVVVEGSADDILSLVDRLSMGLLEGRGTTSLVQAAVRTTGSIEALKSFLRGEAALRRSDVHGAVDHYRRATALDSSFALAHYRLSSAAYRQGIARIPAPAAHAALRHAGRLVREDSLLVAAWSNHVLGLVAEAHRLYEEALVLRPSHVEAAFQLGELLFHWGSSIGIPAAEAREPFSRVLAAEPNNVQAALHLARIAAREGRLEEVDSLVAGMHRADPGGAWTTEMEALRAFLSADAEWQDRTIPSPGASRSQDREILEAMAASSYDLTAVERVARVRAPLPRPPAEQARMELFLAHVRVARGHYRAAVEGIAAASALPAARQLEYRAMLATLPFITLPPGELASLRAEVVAFPDLPLGEEDGPFAVRGFEYPHLLWPGMIRPRRLYLLGALHVQLDDMAAAGAVADSLAREEADAALAVHYAGITRARVAAAGRRPAAAFRALDGMSPSPHRTFESLVDYDRPFERWLRAELLRATGRRTEALSWYATFPDPIARDLAYLAPSHLRRAEIHDAAGDLRQAAIHYQRFVDLWVDADAELQPAVDHARGRLREIGRPRR